MNDLAELWDRQPGEGDERFQAFTTYRDMPIPRSLRRLGEQLGKDASLVARWSRQDGWQDRVAAWDMEQDRQRREAMKAGNIEAGERHATIAAAALNIVSRVNLAWLNRIAADASALGEMPLADLTDIMVRVNRTLPRLVVAERLSRGMTTESIEVAGAAVDREAVAHWTDAELDAFLTGVRSAELRDDDLGVAPAGEGDA